MERMRDEVRRILLFAPVPNQEDLHCTLGNVIETNPSLGKYSNAFKLKILKCRMLIFSEPRIIASPIHGMDCQVYIIMSKDYYKSGKLQHHLERIGIRAGRTARVTNSVYEACLRYSILARIAPLWNQVGSYLVRGREFLLQREPSHAITFDVIMTGKELSMIIWPYRLMLYRISLEELLEGNKENIEFNSEIETDEGKWVYVLPSLNKAQVLSVSKTLPKSSSFTSYKQLKRHWKNSYGYRLPEEEDCSFYVTVTFGQVRPRQGPSGWSGAVYVYPGMCVCQCPPVILGCRDQTVPLQSFLNELSVRVPQICDHPFAGDEVELGYAVPKLHSCSSENNNAPSEQKFKLEDFIETFKGIDDVCHVPIENPTFLVNSTYPSAELFSTKKSAASIFGDKLKQNTQIQSKLKEEESSSKLEGNNDKGTTSTSWNRDVKEKIRYVPVFKSKRKVMNSKSSNGRPEHATNNMTQKIHRNSKETVNISQGKMKNEETDKLESKSTSNKILKFKVFKQKIDGNGLKAHLIGPVKDKRQCITKGPQNILPKFTGQDNALYSNLTAGKLPTDKKNESPIIIKNQVTSKQSELGCTTILQSAKPIEKGQDNTSSLDKKKYVSLTKDKAHYFTMEFGLWDNGKGERSTSQENASLIHWKDILSPSKNLPSGSNQSYQGSVINGVFPLAKSEVTLCEVNENVKQESNLPKKNPMARGRPAVQVGIDVEALAKEGMLSRANTTTLISWLRSRGVACRVKDKKSDLVQSVEKFLGLPKINHATLPQNVQEVNLLS